MPRVIFTDKCESPIEETYATALIGHLEAIASFGFSVHLQYVVDPYRLDFAFVSANGRKICVELDGHEFHDKTPEQAGFDRKRDRFLLLQGWRVVRFTGTEVHRNVAICVSETLLHLQHEVPPSTAQAKLATATAKALIRLTKKTAEKEAVLRSQRTTVHAKRAGWERHGEHFFKKGVLEPVHESQIMKRIRDDRMAYADSLMKSMRRDY